MSPPELPGDPARIDRRHDAETQRRLEFVRDEVNRHKSLRIFGLLSILIMLVVVSPVVIFVDGLSIPRWRKTQLPGSENIVLPTSAIPHISVDVGRKRLTLSSQDGRQITVPIVPPRNPAPGMGRIETWKPGTLSLGPRWPCIERGTAGVLRALGRPSLNDANAGLCLRIDSATYDAIFTHATSQTSVVFE